ncbi:hypothetical protein HY003_02930 [Candidatus Saccharibacteria bacterium]|nr:hypothetical protein [Candidatus Saccharibacteria bacterium]MBI3338228.1 hypothetical protein [Candidatus Saccharibacteria bacterium]
MDSLLILGLVAGLPLALAILFRVSAVFFFLSIVVGNLLAKHFGYDFSVVIGSFMHNNQLDVISGLGLQLLPVGLTVFLTRKSLTTSQIMLHLVPLTLASSALAILALPLLPKGVEGTFYTTSIGAQIRPVEDLVIGLASVSVLFLVWFMPHSGSRHGKKDH